MKKFKVPFEITLPCLRFQLPATLSSQDPTIADTAISAAHRRLHRSALPSNAPRIGDTVCRAGEPCLSDGSETGHLFVGSLGLIWVHSEHAFVDLDLSASYNVCVKAPTGAYCNDKLAFSPHLLATIRY